jgi:hypothetical protein
MFAPSVFAIAAECLKKFPIRSERGKWLTTRIGIEDNNILRSRIALAVSITFSASRALTGIRAPLTARKSVCRSMRRTAERGTVDTANYNRETVVARMFLWAA